MEALEILALFGIPSAITGLAVWWIKRRIEASEKKSKEQKRTLRT